MPSDDRQRLRKEDKIKRRLEISSVFRNGKRCNCRNYLIIYEKNALDRDRFAVLVSRRIGCAVVRNRVKRIFREMFRQRSIILPPFFDILIQPRQGSSFESSHDLKGCFEEWLKTVKR